LKMEPTEGSETSAFENWTPGRYPKEANLHSRHGESLRTKKKNSLRMLISRTLLVLLFKAIVLMY